jgi:hypothetical protein
VFQDEQLPDQEPGFDRRVGVEVKQPFRMSQIEVRRQIHEQMDRVKREEEEERRVHGMKRPWTTNSRRVPLEGLKV